MKVGSVQFSPLSLGSPGLEEWLAREDKTILQHAAAHERLADQLSRRYAELFPADTWIDSATALDGMVLEISSLRWELSNRLVQARAVDVAQRDKERG